MIPTSYISVRAFEGKKNRVKSSYAMEKNQKQNRKLDRATSLAFIAGMMH